MPVPEKKPAYYQLSSQVLLHTKLGSLECKDFKDYSPGCRSVSLFYYNISNCIVIK